MYKYQNTSEAEHLKLKSQAERMKATEYEDFAEFFSAHEELRARMIAAIYSLITDESVTIKYILRRLRCHSTFSQVVVQCLLNLESTISYLKTTCEVEHTDIKLN